MISSGASKDHRLDKRRKPERVTRKGLKSKRNEEITFIRSLARGVGTSVSELAL